MMKRGEIYFANLDLTIGNEIRKIRPVLIVSCNANNKTANTLTVVPITSNIQKTYPFEVFLDEHTSSLSKASKAQCNQIRTISTLRIQRKAGELNTEMMVLVEKAIKLHLSIR